LIGIRFTLTQELKRLARWLRLLGFDTIVSESNESSKLKRICQLQKRILVTRIRKPGKLSYPTHVIIIASDSLAEQLRQVATEAHLYKCAIFSRCLDCNRKVYPIEKSSIESIIPYKVRQREQLFTVCRKCGKIFWRGTHYKAMLQFLCRELDGDPSENGTEFTLTESD